MKENTIYEDVNLAEIRFDESGVSVILDFLDMNGNSLDSITCNNLWHFQYSNTLTLFAHDCLPSYIGEVTSCCVCSSESFNELTRTWNIPFQDAFQESYGTTRNVFFINVESGDIFVKIICESIQIG